MSTLDVVFRLLGPGDVDVLAHVAPDVFDAEIDVHLAREFLRDPRHHLAVAVVEGEVIGFASGVHYVHPDKRPELLVNEVGVAPSYQRRGIGKKLLELLFARASAVGCEEAWLGTEASNLSARALYAAAGGQEEPEPFVLVSFALRPKS